jgi:hypothetical protein
VRGQLGNWLFYLDGFMELSMRLLFLLLAFFPLAAMCKPVLTATCGEPVGTRYDQENGVLLTKPDGFSGVTPVFILDDEKPKVITFIWGAAAWVQKELDQKVSAQEAVIVSTSKDKITAVRVEEGGVTQMYSLYPQKGLVFFTQHRFITLADGVPTASTFYSKCSFTHK